MLVASLVILGLALLVSLLYVLRLRRGVRDLRQAINAIDAYAPMGAELPAEPPTPLLPLQMSIRGLLTRFEGERSFEREQLSAACHEIRSPLTALQTLTELQISRYDEDDTPVTSSAELALARRNVKRIEDLVNDVLALSLTAHADHPFAAWGPIEIVSLVRTEATAHSMAVPVHASITTATVSGDPRRLRWAVSNLIANATEHCRSRVEVSIRNDEMTDGRPAIAVRVTDDGAGLGSDDPQRLMLRFRRGSSAVSKSAASGLGLTIVQSVVDDHGGEVWIEPECELGGAGFTLVLPVAATMVDVGDDDLANHAHIAPVGVEIPTPEPTVV